MKILQVVLLGLFQAQAAKLSNESEDGPTTSALGNSSSLPNCAVPCKAQLHLSVSKVEECLVNNCGSSSSNLIYIMSQEDRMDNAPKRKKKKKRNKSKNNNSNTNRNTNPANGNNNSDEEDSCIARCNLIRCTLSCQDRCKYDCNKNGAHKKSSFNKAEGKQDKDTNYVGILPAKRRCIAQCKRNHSPGQQRQTCINGCSQREESEEKSSFGAEKDKSSQNPGSSSYAHIPPAKRRCIAQCKRNHSPGQERQTCIDGCGQRKESAEKSSFGAEEAR